MYKAFWVKNDNNFGDILTPAVLNYFNIPFEYSSQENANLFCIGSIAHRANKNSIVLGSGIIKEKTSLNPEATWKFVRGPYTREKILKLGGTCPLIYGDPALLLPLFVDESKKEHNVGIVPHFVDYELVKFKYPKLNIINLINPDPILTAKEITKCRYIISSSLHGIIVANAYGIPAAWVKFSNNIKGDDIKFKDYFASINVNPILSTLEDPVFLLGKTNLSPLIHEFEKLRI